MKISVYFRKCCCLCSVSERAVKFWKVADACLLADICSLAAALQALHFPKSICTRQIDENWATSNRGSISFSAIASFRSTVARFPLHSDVRKSQTTTFCFWWARDTKKAGHSKFKHVSLNEMPIWQMQSSSQDYNEEDVVFWVLTFHQFILIPICVSLWL